MFYSETLRATGDFVKNNFTWVCVTQVANVNLVRFRLTSPTWWGHLQMQSKKYIISLQFSVFCGTSYESPLGLLTFANCVSYQGYNCVSYQGSPLCQLPGLQLCQLPGLQLCQLPGLQLCQLPGLTTRSLSTWATNKNWPWGEVGQSSIITSSALRTAWKICGPLTSATLNGLRSLWNLFERPLTRTKKKFSGQIFRHFIWWKLAVGLHATSYF